jgi:hypothetical protein
MERKDRLASKLLPPAYSEVASHVLYSIPTVNYATQINHIYYLQILRENISSNIFNLSY